MDIIDQLVNFFKQPEEKTKKSTPEGICPVCWGHQEYDHQIRTLFRDKQIDVNNHQARYLVIQDFMIEHIDGIRLREGTIEGCPTCGNGRELEKEA
jgi:hypothetical protein